MQKPPSEESFLIMLKYKEEQASHGPIEEFMTANGLLLSDYKAANELLHQHSIESTEAVSNKLVEVWSSNSPTGRALRLMSAWNEWQVENTNYASDIVDWEGVKKAVNKVEDWDSIKDIMENGNLVKTKEDYLQLLSEEQSGQKLFYRKGDFDKAIISTTGDSKGANTGKVRIIPDHVISFQNLRKKGYHLMSGARGLVGLTSSKENEYIWIKPTDIIQKEES